MGIQVLGGQGLSTKKGTFSTGSTTYVTALNITGPGVLKSLYYTTASTVMTVNVRVTLDGTVFNIYQGTSNGAYYSAQRDGTLSGANPPALTGLDLNFRSSCLVEINTTAGTPTLTFVYDN